MPQIQMIACHYANKSGRGQAATFLPLDTVEDLVEAGQAVWNKRRTYVNFTKTEAAMTPTARSLKMGPEVIEGFCDGDEMDIACVNAWRGRAA